jgi:4-alpha-glucanotransferase
VPGTVAEHPNWRRKLPIDLGALERDARLAALAAAIVAERRSGGRGGRHR